MTPDDLRAFNEAAERAKKACLKGMKACQEAIEALEKADREKQETEGDA